MMLLRLSMMTKTWVATGRLNVIRIRINRTTALFDDNEVDGDGVVVDKGVSENRGP